MFSTDLIVADPEADGMVLTKPYILPADEVSILPVEDGMIRDPNWNPPKGTSVYDDQGRLLSETYEYDWDGDGAIDSRYTSEYRYDGNTTTTTSTEDQGADGTIEFRSSHSSTVDANGNVLASSYESDYNGDGGPSKIPMVTASRTPCTLAVTRMTALAI
jgi:hypothetical protein